MLQNLFRLPFIRISYIILCTASVLALQFYQLGDLPVVQWDESRLAVNAAEMAESGNFLVPTFKNQADHYNTKPPLMIWLQVFSSYLFGMNEFALRFPSALAGLICILFAGYIVYKKTENSYAGGFTALLLASSMGFIQLHGSMTGDFDALLSLFLLLSIYYYQRFLLRKARNSFLYFSLFFSLALLSKSAAACLVIPCFFLNALYAGKTHKLLPTLYALLLACIPLVLYAGIREIYDSGYIVAMLENDFLGRFSRALEGHTSPWYYYIDNFITYRFNWFIWLLLPALIFNFLDNSRTTHYYSLFFLLYLLFLSLAQTRIHWYDMPLLPLIAIAISLALYRAYGLLSSTPLRIAYVVAIAVALYFPMREKAEFIFERQGIELDFSHYELSRMLRSKTDDAPTLYLAAPYDPEFYFYAIINPSIQRAELQDLRINDVVYHGNLYRDSLQTKFIFTTLDSSGNAWKVRINKIK